MAVTDIEMFTPVLPERDRCDPSLVRFSYDRPSDTLYVLLHGRALPAVSVDAGPDLSLQSDLETRAVIGLQIEHFLRRVVRQQPALLAIAELAGVPSAEVTMIRDSLPLEARRRAAVDAVFAQLPALAYETSAPVGAPLATTSPEHP